MPIFNETQPEVDLQTLQQQIINNKDAERPLVEPVEPSQPGKTSSESPAKPASGASKPAQPAQPGQRPQSPGQRGFQEAGTALVGGAIDAVEGIGSNLQQAFDGATGRGPKPGETFTPTWLQVPDDIEPQNKTWWGNAARGMVQLTLLSAATAKLGRRGGKLVGVGPAKGPVGQLGRTVATGAVASNLSTFSTEDNLTKTISDAIPWFPKFLATNDSDGPWMRRLKNTLEGAGFDGALSAVGAGLKARAAVRKAGVAEANPQLRDIAIAQGVEGQQLAKLEAEAKAAREAVKAAKQAEQIVAAGDPANLPKAQAETAAARAAAKLAANAYREAKKASTPEKIYDVVEAETRKRIEKVRADTELENAQKRFEDDPDGLNGPDPWASNPDLFDPTDRAFTSAEAPKNAVKTAIKNFAKTTLDPNQKGGRLGNILTDSKLEKVLTGGRPAVRKVLNEMIDAIQSGDTDFQLTINGLKATKQQTLDAVVSAAYDALKVTDDPENLDALAQYLRTNSNTVFIKGQAVEYLNRTNTAATQLLLRVTAEEIADLSNVYRSYDHTGIVDVKHLGDLLDKRLEFLLKEHKLASYIRGSELQSQNRNFIEALVPTEAQVVAKSLEINREVESIMATIRQARDSGDEALLKSFISAASISDGNIRTLNDLANYMKKRVGINGWLRSTPEERGYLLRGLTSTFYNSVLSSPKTVIRAWAGTGLSTMLRPIAMFAGGVGRGDTRIIAKSLAQLNAVREGWGEAAAMMAKAQQAWMDGSKTVNNLATDASLQGGRVAYHKTQEFIALKEWAELKGTNGEKAAVRMAENLSAFNAYAFVNYTVGLMDMGDSFFRTILARMELKGQAFDEAWAANGGKVNGSLIRRYEDTFRSKIFDEDGVITDVAARMAGDEVTLTTPLDGTMKGLTEALQQMPLLTPFVMFPRTAINAITLIGKHTPIVNGYIREVDEVMNATIETAPRIMQKYGITDLAAAQAMHEGRVALGNVVVASAIGLYLAGNVTGNGPADKATRDHWIKLGWAPRSIKIGDRWVSYESLEPFHTFLALTADIGDNLNDLGETTAMDGFGRIGYIIAMNATNKTFMSGLTPFMEMISGGIAGSPAVTAAAQTINNTLPWAGLRNMVSQAVSPGMREVGNSIWERIYNRNPFLKNQLPMLVDELDGSQIRDHDPITNIYNSVSPFLVNPDWDETRETLRISGFDVKTGLSVGLGKEKLSRQAQAAIKAEMGKENILGQLKTLFESDKYKESFAKLQRDRDRGIPAQISGQGDNWHLIQIKRIFDRAKDNALARYYQTAGATDALRQARIRGMATRAAQQGESGVAGNYLQDIMKVPK